MELTGRKHRRLRVHLKEAEQEGTLRSRSVERRQEIIGCRLLGRYVRHTLRARDKFKGELNAGGTADNKFISVPEYKYVFWDVF